MTYYSMYPVRLAYLVQQLAGTSCRLANHLTAMTKMTHRLAIRTGFYHPPHIVVPTCPKIYTLEDLIAVVTRSGWSRSGLQKYSIYQRYDKKELVLFEKVTAD